MQKEPFKDFIKDAAFHFRNRRSKSRKCFLNSALWRHYTLGILFIYLWYQFNILSHNFSYFNLRTFYIKLIFSN
jgi:hypothetical protein